MSSLTTLYGDRYIRDPRIAFDKQLIGSTYLFTSDMSGSKIGVNTGPNFFTPFGVSASITSANTYVTVADITGKGFLFAVIGPGDGGSTGVITTIKITVDGILYTITGGASSISPQRLVLAPYYGYGFPTASYQSEHIGLGSLGHMSPESVDNSTPRYGFNKYFYVPSYWNGKATGLNSVRFDTSLKVEVKQSTFYDETANKLTGCSYRLDV